MTTRSPTARDLDAVSFDALGTLLRLAEPAPRLRESLLVRLGISVPIDRCAAAMHAEQRHYRQGAGAATDAAALATLRLACAEVLADGLAIGVDGPELLPSLTDAIAIEVDEDATNLLERLNAAGLRVALVSNWDVSLHDVLGRTALRPLFAAVVASADCGHAKPDPAIFLHAARQLGAVPSRLLHVGDDPVADVDGARAAGLHAVLLQRDGAAAARRPRIATLQELPALLDLDRAPAKR